MLKVLGFVLCASILAALVCYAITNTTYKLLASGRKATRDAARKFHPPIAHPRTGDEETQNAAWNFLHAGPTQPPTLRDECQHFNGAA